MLHEAVFHLKRRTQNNAVPCNNSRIAGMHRPRFRYVLRKCWFCYYAFCDNTINAMLWNFISYQVLIRNITSVIDLSIISNLIVYSACYVDRVKHRSS